MNLAIKIEPEANNMDFDEAAFEKLLSEIRERRKEFHEQRYISNDVIDSLKKIGLYRALVPEQFGGSGMTPGNFIRRIEQIAHADGSTGWVASFAFGSKYLASLPAETLAELYADGPDAVFAGTVFPPQPAEKTENGYIVNGRWPFGSGCKGATVLGVGISVADKDGGGLPMMAVMPAEKVEIDETWDTIGMAATGSHHLVVKDVLVEPHWTFVRGAAPTIDTPANRYPTLAMAAQVLAVCGLGSAQAALDHVMGFVGTTKSITGAPTLGTRENVQTHLGRSEAKLQAARAWFYETTECVWQKVLQKEELAREDHLALRLASSHLAETSAEVARTCFEMVGTAGIFSANPLARFMTDAMVTAQHAFLTEGTFMNGGKVLLGHDPIPGYA